jgi:hypothetical protein
VSGPCDLTNFTCPQDQVFITDTSLDLNRKNPYSVQWSIGVSRRLTATLAFDIGYVGNKGERLSFSPEYNRPDRLTGTNPVRNFSGRSRTSGRPGSGSSACASTSDPHRRSAWGSALPGAGPRGLLQYPW